MYELRGIAGKRFAVLGLGRTGLAAVRSLTASGATVVAWDEVEEVRSAAERTGVELLDLNQPDCWKGIYQLLVSPGIAHHYPRPNAIVANAVRAGVSIDNDIGIFFRSNKFFPSGDEPCVIGVTGSNGKSTTTALIDHVLKSSGKCSQYSGNIGIPVLGIDACGGGDFVVLEVSSYQAELARCLMPHVAIFLNLSPDHMERHGGIGGYFAAKSRLIMSGSEMAIIGVDEYEGMLLAALAETELGEENVTRLSVRRELEEAANAVSCMEGMLTARIAGRLETLDLSELRCLSGIHNHQNACAAFAACRAVGLGVEDIAVGFRSFSGLPHRTQIVGERDGVLYVNDSKATNAESAAMALSAFPRIRWIAGGLEKEGGISQLQDHFQNVVKAYLFGHSGRSFALQIGKTPYMLCTYLAEAVSAAVADATAGDTVLLSPAAASFDQYADFEDRGNHFVKLIEELQDGE